VSKVFHKMLTLHRTSCFQTHLQPRVLAVPKLLRVDVHRYVPRDASSELRCKPAPNLMYRKRIVANLFPFDQAWAPNIDAASIAPQLFAFSLFPYLAFLYYLTRCGQTPKLALFGFYFLLVFVGATIPAGIYAKSHYGTSLANVDWLHGAAESLLTITNLFVVLGLRQGIRAAEQQQQQQQKAEQQQGQAQQQVEAATRE